MNTTYDYDIFGSPITGDYTTGTDYGYLGKPYDSITGLYNYGTGNSRLKEEVKNESKKNK